MDNEELKQRIAQGVRAVRAQEQARAAAVVVALVPSGKGDLGGKGDGLGDFGVLLEVRASTLDQQPGEVCCPGGHVEPGETPEQAAVRETCEELLVSPGQVSLVGSLGTVGGPGGLPLHAFVAQLSDYRATFSADEVASVFTVPVSWLLEHEPHTYRVRYDPVPPADFPWEKVEGGHAYRWRPKYEDVPFYEDVPAYKADGDAYIPGEQPVVWGATARVLRLFSRVLRAGA